MNKWWWITWTAIMLIQWWLWATLIYHRKTAMQDLNTYAMIKWILSTS